MEEEVIKKLKRYVAETGKDFNLGVKIPDFGYVCKYSRSNGGAFVIPCANIGGSWKVLAIKQKRGNDGDYTFPQGYAHFAFGESFNPDVHDADLYDTAVRELKEETGITKPFIKKMCQVSGHFEMADSTAHNNNLNVTVAHIMALVEPGFFRAEKVEDDDEAYDIEGNRWMGLKEAEETAAQINRPTMANFITNVISVLRGEISLMELQSQPWETEINDGVEYKNLPRDEIKTSGWEMEGIIRQTTPLQSRQALRGFQQQQIA